MELPKEMQEIKEDIIKQLSRIYVKADVPKFDFIHNLGLMFDEGYKQGLEAKKASELSLALVKYSEKLLSLVEHNEHD